MSKVVFLNYMKIMEQEANFVINLSKKLTFPLISSEAEIHA